MKKRILLAALAALFFATGCAPVPKQQQGLLIGSATSKNLFLDSSQFANRKVKLRLRNSSGDPQLDTTRLRSIIERGFQSAGYQLAEEGFGLLVDVNLYQVQSAASTRVRDSSGLSALLGGVVGYEIARQQPGGMATGSGAIAGAIVGYKLEEIIRANSEVATYIALCDVNIGVVRRESRAQDSIVIGGNKFVFKDESEAPTYANFALRDAVRVAVYAGDDYEKRLATIDALMERLGRIVANLI